MLVCKTLRMRAFLGLIVSYRLAWFFGARMTTKPLRYLLIAVFARSREMRFCFLQCS